MENPLLLFNLFSRLSFLFCHLQTRKSHYSSFSCGVKERFTLPNPPLFWQLETTNRLPLAFCWINWSRGASDITYQILLRQEGILESFLIPGCRDTWIGHHWFLVSDMLCMNLISPCTSPDPKDHAHLLRHSTTQDLMLGGIPSMSTQWCSLPRCKCALHPQVSCMTLSPRC